MAFPRFFALHLLLVLLSGCSAWNRFDVQNGVPQVGASGPIKSVAVAAVDNRELLRDRDILPNYVGMMRGGFGIPNSVHTKGGRSLADSVAEAAATGLTEAGYRASFVRNSTPLSRAAALLALQGTKADRFLLLIVEDYNFETFIRTEMWYKVRAEVLDRTGRVLASAETEKVIMLKWILLPGGIQTEARRQVVHQTAVLLGELLNNPAIRQQL